ncbi:FAS1-like dehydratase domain-containing protein [Rhodovulum euryhalinum]|nr:MaoC family dehydratase N-terminal domain-containing protein [Rhodovulum euryhalinum]
MAAQTVWQDWIGRTETRQGCLTVELAGMLSGALGHAAAPAPGLAPGAAMPPLWHWAAFPEFVPLSELGTDGHPRLGGFLPPLPYARRMWAGGRLGFEGQLRIGEALEKRSEILAVDEKQGATGPMVFVRVAHVTVGGAGRVEEEQDIVYLDIPERFTPPKKLPLPEAPAFDERVPVNEARLFRYSAATYNAHRIHYDLPYAREVEKYPGLVVHGPMQATLLMEAGLRHAGGSAPRAFRFRGVHPMFADEDMRLIGKRDEDGALELCTGTPSGHQCLQARLELV